MAVTFNYGGWAEMTNVQITRMVATPEPGGGTAQRASTLWVISGTGIVAMTADSNGTTGVRRRLANIERILTTPGQRLTIAFDGVTVIDHSSADYSPGGQSGTTTDFGYGPFMSATVTELSGARVALVEWTAELRMWSDVSNLNPIVGFVMTMKHTYDRSGMLTLTRSGVLTVRRSAGFPAKDGDGLTGDPPTLIAFAPGATQPFGGGQTPTASGVPTTLGNNPDLYRRFVCGPLFTNFVRESQDYYIDESMQRLFFTVTDKQVSTPYPAIVTDATVNFSYEMNIQGGPLVITKNFSAELYSRPTVPKSQLLTVAVDMSKNRIQWSSGNGVPGDVIVRMSIKEPDMLNRNGIIFEVQALGTNLGYAFSPDGVKNIFAPITGGVQNPNGGSSASPDAYGNMGLVTLQDFVYEAAPLNTHVTPNQTGASVLGRVPVRNVVAQVVPQQVGDAMASLLGEETHPIPPGDQAGAAENAPDGYMRVESMMSVTVDNRFVVANAATVSGPDRVYQFGKPRVIAYERIAVQRKNVVPAANIAYTPLPWGHVELGKTPGAVSPPHVDANGNTWYTAMYERWSQVLSSAFVTAPIPSGGVASVFQPKTTPQPGNPQIDPPRTGDYPVIPSSIGGLGDT